MKIGSAQVTEADIYASNGVIHVVNSVILPESPKVTQKDSASVSQLNQIKIIFILLIHNVSIGSCRGKEHSKTVDRKRTNHFGGFGGQSWLS